MDQKSLNLAKIGLDSIPRILSCLDRNSYSPTYGCFHRDYWLYKTSDFPDAVRQFGVHALALVYSNKLIENPYFENKKILDWTKAGLLYWASIQHTDGSFDEFYPNERGWVGPTAFTTYTSIETYNIIKNKISQRDSDQIINAINKAAQFISKGDHEGDHLANHHAMACLALWKASQLLNDKSLRQSYEKALTVFKSYHNFNEGWSLEYDGIDPGYLSATISFLGKIYQDNHSDEILEIAKQSIEMCSYFIYPNGYYAGSMGSRNTMHFYSHGFEIFKDVISLSSLISETMLTNISNKKLVPPEIMSDRYLFYRVPEILLTYIDYKKHNPIQEQLPFEKNTYYKYFQDAKIMVESSKNIYILANLAKGGVLKIFRKDKKELLINDCGIIAQLSSKKVITSQWIDKDYKIKVNKDGFHVTGRLNIIPSNKFFNIPKLIIFRLVLLIIGWTPLTHYLKGWIRKFLMVGNRRSNIHFSRELIIEKEQVIIKTNIENKGKNKFTRVLIGDEFFVRYVPQSRFFQSQELALSGYKLSKIDLETLNLSKKWSYQQEIQLK